MINGWRIFVGFFTKVVSFLRVYIIPFFPVFAVAFSFFWRVFYLFIFFVLVCVLVLVFGVFNSFRYYCE